MPQTQGRSSTRTRVGSAPADRELVITRSFNAPRALVFKAWTEKDRIWQWLGPKNFTTLLFETDARPGGRWRARSRSPEGKEFSQHGIIREISSPERFVFTQIVDDAPDKETEVTIVLSEHKGLTTMNFQQGVFDTAEARDRCEDGWNQSFDRLDAHLATAREG